MPLSWRKCLCNIDFNTKRKGQGTKILAFSFFKNCGTAPPLQNAFCTFALPALG